MKTRHLPTVFRHDPWFVVRNVAKMAAHIYRGSTLRTVLGLEDKRQAFVRYKEIREQERQYL
jgi:anaerobic magnesium-protoporphyrin IX monomethyl ester cyclase